MQFNISFIMKLKDKLLINIVNKNDKKIGFYKKHRTLGLI